MCIINNCSNTNITSDNYCNIHKNFTTNDYNIIYDYIKLKIEEINPIDNNIKLNKLLRLIKYILYRKMFLREHIGLLNVIIKKIEYFYDNILYTILYNKKTEDRLIDLYIKLNFILDDIKKENIENNII